MLPTFKNMPDLSGCHQHSKIDLISNVHQLTIIILVTTGIMTCTFSPALLYISGFSCVLQTLWRMVVFPAFALPMMRIRKRLIFIFFLNSEGSMMEEG